MKLNTLYADMVKRVRDGATRLQAAWAMENVAAVRSEARALAAQAGALAELLEGELEAVGRFKGRKERENG